MYELVQAGARTYYINCPAKMGLYLSEEGGAYLIDSGNDKEAGKKVLKILEKEGWPLKAVINTHSNADHIGGNHLLQQRTDCPVFSRGAEAAFTQYPILEPSFLYGGYPCKELRNKFLMAQDSRVTAFTTEAVKIPDDDPVLEQLEVIPLEGHFFHMAGFRTPDDVVFLADCLTNALILDKYQLFFIYDVGAFLETLDNVENMKAKLFIPAHADAAEDIGPLVQINRNKVYEIMEKISSICQDPMCFEDILQRIFTDYQLVMDFNQYVLVGSTVRSYLSFLKDCGKLAVDFVDNKLLWNSVQS